MFGKKDIVKELSEQSSKKRDKSEDLLAEAKRILKKDLFAEDKILQNLGQYNKSHEKLDEEDLTHGFIFSIEDIRRLAIKHRLKFLDSKHFKSQIPYEAVLKIKYLDETYHKSITHFRILSLPESFSNTAKSNETVLFAQTNYDNYYLIHSWGSNKVDRLRQFKFWPMRHFENLVVTVLLTTLIIVICLPTKLITLDPNAVYWSGYRAAAFFHILIFNLGVTAYITFAFGKNFNSSIWNRYRDFD